MVNLDEPPFLAVGTEVSAKYKGAFCEAKIRKISKSVKCKIQYSNGQVSFVSDDAVKGQLKIGANVEVKCNEKKELLEGIIQKIQDHSQYTVVFDDGDITCLKRSALCLKSGKHFAASATLDQLPLTHPEHITSPTRNTIVYGRRSRKHKKSVGESGEEEILEMEEKDIGKVVCIESNDKKKIRDNWFPGLVVAPTAQSAVKTNVLEDYLVRSFKDGKYYTVPKKEITEFTKEIAAKVENPTLKTAVEKAILYLDKDELPPHWDRDLLFGLEKNCVTTDSEGAYDSDNSDEESIEEKDHFVAQLFKFMDDRGTPLNQAPMINDKDVDMYKLFKVVNNLGGFNKVGKCKQWKTVAQKVGHEQSVFSVKQYYQQYLHSFEDFYRKLGCTMLSHPRGVRSRSRFSRSIIRDVDKALPGTSTSSSDKNKQTTAAIKLEPKEKKEKIEISIKEADVVKEPVTPKKSSKALKVEDKVAVTVKSSDEHVTKKVDKKKDRPETIGKETEPIVKEPLVPKKPLKPVKVEEKIAATLKNNDEIPHKVDRKKEKSEIVLKETEMTTESANKKPSKTKVEETITCPSNSSRNKSSIKCDTALAESKDPPKDSKVKKEFKEATIKKEEEKIIEESAVNKTETKPADKADEKKKYSRNLFGKSMRRRIKKEKVEKTKPIETGLSGIRKMRSIKEQIKTFVKVITPSFKKPKRGASANQIEVTTKPKLEEELPKLTRSKSKDELPTRARKVSVSPLSSYVPCASTVEAPNKIKKTDEGSEKKKSIRKKKEDKDDKPVLNDSLLSSDVEYCDKDTIVSVGDNLVVYYGDKHATTYDAKVLNVCDIEGIKKYYVHYKGWNSRYDEWIDLTRIALKSKAPEPEPDLDNDGDDSSKSEQKNMEMKKMPPVNMSSRTRRSLTPCMSSYAGGRKKSPFGSSRPTRTCTMVDQPLSSIGKYTIRDNSDSESEYSGNLGLAKQYNKRNHQSLKMSKAERDDGSPTKTGDSPESDGQKKSLYPKTYPSKEALLQRSGPKKPKICGFRAHGGADNKPSDEAKISGGEKATPKKQQPPPTLSPVVEYGTPPSKTLAKNKDDEDADGIGDDFDVDDGLCGCRVVKEAKRKNAVIHYPSPREKSERNADRRQPSSTPELPSAATAPVGGLPAERKPIESSSPVKKFPKPARSSSSSVAYYHSSSSSLSLSPSSASSSEDEQIQLKSRIAEDEKPPPLLKKRGEESKPSVTGTDFDLNEIRSEMKGLTTGHVPPQPPTLSSNGDNVAVVADGSSPDVEPPRLKAEVRSRRGSTETTEDVYEFKEPEPCDLQALPSAIDEKRCDRRLVKHSEPPKLYSFDKLVEQSTPMTAVADDSGALDVFRSVIHSGLPTDNLDPKDGQDKTEPFGDYGKNDEPSPPVVVWPVVGAMFTAAPSIATKVVRPDEVLDLCMKPVQCVPASEAAFVAGISCMDSDDSVDDEEDEDEEDDDDAKLVIAENDKIENDYQMEMADDDEDVDREQVNWSSGGHPADDGCVRDASPPPADDADENSKGSDTVVRHERSRTPKQDVDDESTVSCNENDDQQDAAVHQSAFQVYAGVADHQSGKTPVYQPFLDNNDSTRSGYDFELSPTSSTTESAKETMFKLSSGDMADFKDPAVSAAGADQQRNLTGNDPENRTGVSELQCREEIVDEETLNNAIVSNYGRNVDYDIHKPSTSKGFFNAIHHQPPQQQPVREHHFYESKSPSKLKAEGGSSLFEPGSSKGNVPFDSGADKKVVYEDKPDPSKDGGSSSLYDNCAPSTSKCNFYDPNMPSTSKGFYSPEADVNNVLFCEETIPGSPTGAADDQYDQEDRKKSINQYYEEREAASAMFAMNLAFRKSAIASNDSQSHDYDMHHGDANIDQRHLRFLAEVSSRDESSYFTKPVIPEPQPTALVEQVTKVEKPQAKRKISTHEHPTGKRNKAHISALPDTESERYDHSKILIPIKDGKPLVTFAPEMDSAQRQAVILAKINELRKDYTMVKARIVVVDRRRKKIRKRKRELAKSNAALNPNKQSPVAATK